MKTVAEHQVAITFASSEAQPGRALSEIKKGRNDGMVSLEQTLARMIRSGRLALDTALSVSGDPQSLGELVRSNG